MLRTHPHAAAVYRVISFADGSFGVEVNIPDSYPTIVSRFLTEADAETWIAEHQRKIQTQTQTRGWFSNSGRHQR